jgi:rubrerythrin
LNTPNLLDAIRIVKENERLASETYANAAKQVSSLGKELFVQLSDFEKFHYEKLTALEKSLEESGKFINYEGKALILPPKLEIKFAKVPEHKSLMEIITEAKKIEKQSEKVYGDLAEQLDDPQGHAMFAKLSEEEHMHYVILSEAFWSLNQNSIWVYTRPQPN